MWEEAISSISTVVNAVRRVVCIVGFLQECCQHAVDCEIKAGNTLLSQSVNQSPVSTDIGSIALERVGHSDGLETFVGRLGLVSVSRLDASLYIIKS